MSIGEELRQAREQMGASPADVENETKIRTKYIMAMENDAFDVLPGKAYVKGFLRNYARFLGLDGEALVDRYEEQFAPRVTEEENDEVPKPVPRNNRLAGRWKGLSAVALALMVLALVYWGTTLVISRSDNISDNGRPPGVSDSPNGQGNDHRQAPDLDNNTEVPETTGVDMVLQVLDGESWMQVVVDDESVFEGTVGPNNVKQFAGQESIWIKLGNAGVVKVRVNGRDYGFLDGPGQVVTKTFTDEDDRQTAGG